jgi:hypothetical protein
MKKSGSGQKDITVIAVPSVEEARMSLLAAGLFEICLGSDNSVIDNETDVQVRLISISRELKGKTVGHH